MFFPIETQDVTSIDYRVPTESSENSLNISIEPIIPNIQVTVEDITKFCEAFWKTSLRNFLLPDIISIRNPILQSKIATTVVDVRATYENALIDDLLSERYVVTMPPVKRQTLHLTVKRVVKPDPFV